MPTKPDVHKLLNDLQTGSMDQKRIAAEALGQIETSAVEIVTALEYLAEQPSSPYDGSQPAIDAAKRALQNPIHQATRKQAGLSNSIEREEEHRRRLASVILSTTTLLDGYHVEEYLGVAFSEVVLGTGIFSEFNAKIADIFGSRSSGFQNKLQKARDLAVDDLRRQAVDRGAHGVIGIDLDYAALMDNVLMVVANGTLVKIKRHE